MSRILALDWGGQRIGVAVSEGYLANPHSVINRRTKARDYARIQALIDTLAIEILVLGLPESLNPEAPIGPQAKSVLRHKRNLTRMLNIPVVLVNEAYSTVEAEEFLQESGKSEKIPIDAAAAAVILQRYLDQQSAPHSTVENIG